MPKLRVIACTAVAALSALGISVGAAVAETANTPPAHVVIGKDGKPAPRVCFLHKLL
jgi:adenine/guanine phosphoribosyltransferase-like PRPP-binding protein